MLLNLFFPWNIDVYKFLLTLIKFVQEHLREDKVFLDYRMDFDKAEYDAFPYVCVLVAHQMCKDISETDQVFDQILRLNIRQLLLLQYMLEFILHHSEQRLKPGWLFVLKQWLNSLR